jgi:Mn2+/Fe2+ NRAMP family transporter
MSDNPRGESAPPRDPDDVLTIEKPPTTVLGILRRLGPGLIVAGSIVGSGELIGTTKTGSEAGFWLLWLILIGCVIKVFAQVELGRYSLVGGKTTMFGLNEVPGPAVEISLTGERERRSIRGNWLVWYWFLMWFAGIGQLGGIVGGVGQALAISVPLTQDGREFNAFVDDKMNRQVMESQLRLAEQRGGQPATSASVAKAKEEVAKLHARIVKAEAVVVASLAASAGAIGEDDAPTLDEVIAALGEYQYRRLGGRLVDKSFKRKRLTDEKQKSIDAFHAKLGPQRIREQGLEAAPPDYDAALLALGRARFQELGGHADAAQQNPAFLAAVKRFVALDEKPPTPLDEFVWAGIIAVITSVVLVIGRYNFIQTFSTVLVASFTLVTIVNVAMLQLNPDWSVSWGDIAAGMSFRLPPATGGSSAGLATALATFGIIGVGASELVSYPYWCLEKGYARFTGPRSDNAEWAERARGWMRVMRWDAWCSMVVYTFATIAFYLLGAAVLGRTGLNPGGNDLIRTLAVMYEPVFGSTAQVLFLFGAFAVLYSTYFVANASHARVFSDALRVLGFIDQGEATRRRWIRALSGVFPLLCVAVYIVIPSPAELVLISGLMQAGMLPMLAIAALYFRYLKNDPRIAPGPAWDIFLWISTLGMGVAGVWAFWEKLSPMVLGK